MAAGEGCHLYERVWVNLVRERRARVGKGAGESDRGEFPCLQWVRMCCIDMGEELLGTVLVLRTGKAKMPVNVWLFPPRNIW